MEAAAPGLLSASKTPSYKLKDVTKIGNTITFKNLISKSKFFKLQNGKTKLFQKIKLLIKKK